MIIYLDEITEDIRDRVGGKAYSLSRMMAGGISVPPGVVLAADAYRQYVTDTKLQEQIIRELGRKDFADMRWEEIWDAALRIRNMFLNTDIPRGLTQQIRPVLNDRFEQTAVVVRSSALAEDSAGASFAGLHESYPNVKGTAEILKHVRLVWASLWSDAALLYRQELGLDVETSAMPVVIQEIITGDCSGVAFSVSPSDSSRSVIEAVWGLNEGMVDGTVEPDRWLVDREDARIVSHDAASEREACVRPAPEGTTMEPLSDDLRQTPPLEESEVIDVYRLARNAEATFGAPQDVEWTWAQRALFALQSRNITTLEESDAEDDERPWYLTLRRSFENLKTLREKIESEILPGMEQASEQMAQIDPADLSDADLADEIRRRQDIYDHWHDVYWDDLIPFAHGVRLFGQVYNDVMEPEDPYEFVDLLADTGMQSMERNRLLDEMAEILREDQQVADRIRSGEYGANEEYERLLEEYLEQFGDVSSETVDRRRGRRLVSKLALEMAGGDRETTEPRESSTDQLAERFLAQFEGEAAGYGEELLDLARASYRIRDDDNIYIGKVKGGLTAATAEGLSRLEDDPDPERTPAEEIARALEEPGYTPQQTAEKSDKDEQGVQARQIVGQPAGPGIVRATARVIHDSDDLFDFSSGEILVCDAVEPDMTFVVPLAAGIVERRGGMLIHGAIIAREYGLPCVTGVPDATRRIATGDEISVDGYLGTVTIHRDQ